MKRVLIVEDDKSWSMVIGHYCQSLGYDFTVVSAPQVAMDVIDEFAPDVIVLDMLLATETGVALLNELRSYDDLSSIPVVVCSSLSELSMDHLRPFGVSALLDKNSMEPLDFQLALQGALT